MLQTSRNTGRVQRSRVVNRVVQSWGSVIFALMALAATLGLCFLAIMEFAPGAAKYFLYGMTASTILSAIMLVFNEPIVVLALGAKRVRSRNDAPLLWDAVERVNRAAVMPRVYNIPQDGMNACAFGLGLPYLSAVAATDGLVRRLNDDELAAVMAHEIGHILNKDILVSTIINNIVMSIAMTGWMLLRIAPYGNNSRSSSNSKGSGAAALFAVFVVGLAMYGFGRILGYILQMFVSRQREYAADARSALIMGSGRPLAAALQKVVRNPAIGDERVGALVGFFCTADPEPSDVLSTHPSLDKRIAALEALEAA